MRASRFRRTPASSARRTGRERLDERIVSESANPTLRLLRLGLGLAVGGLLFGMMALTFVDVVGRYVFAAPVPGAFEVTKLAMALLVFAALPLATSSREHVTISILDSVLPARAVRLQTAAADIVCAVALAVIGWRVFAHGLQLASYNEATTFLEIAYAPFVFVMGSFAGLAALCSLLLVGHLPPSSAEGRP